VFTWGDSPAGQLGHGDHKMSVRPKAVTGLYGKTVVDIAAGDLHTLFVAGLRYLFILRLSVSASRICNQYRRRRRDSSLRVWLWAWRKTWSR
jgi:hypothetical protein